MCIASLLVSCSGNKSAKSAKDAWRFINEHDLKHLPRSDIPLVVNERVVAWIQYFQGAGRRHFERYLRRSGKYMPLMKKILKQQGMPEDLVYIALIESGFNDNARSHANAVGNWQFIRSTGKLYGLRVDGWVDERRDPHKATYAAAKFFADLHDEFGDWYLAMAGYNAGPGRVRKAIKMTGSKDFWKHASHRRALRAETRDYVPKYIAAAIMAKDPARFGFKNIDYEEPLEFDISSVDTQTDISVIAKCAGISEDEVAKLNAHLVRGATPPNQKNYRIKLPKGSEGKFKVAYAKLPEDERIKIVRHKVRSGDTLYKLARRYGVSTSALASANGIGRRSKLRRGQTLVIPVGAYAARFAKADSSGRGSRSKVVRYKVRRGDTLSTIAAKYKGVTVAKLRKWNRMGRRSMIREGQRLKIYTRGAPSRSSGSRGTKTAYHRVKRGETLGGIAARNGTTSKQLMAWNGIKDPKRLKVGQKLRVSKKVASPANTTAIDLSEVATKEATATHKLRKGETLYSVASRYGMTTKELMAVNDIRNPRRVRAGRKLKVYGKASKKTVAGGTTAINLENATSAKVQADSVHVLKSGETLGHVAERYGVSSKKIMAWNGIKDPRRVRAGTKLKIKGGSAPTASKAPSSKSTAVAASTKKASSGSSSTHTLKSGETLGHVAERYGVSSKKIMAWNGIKDPRRVRAGTKLKIKGGTKPAMKRQTNAAPEGKPVKLAKSSGSKPVSHKVRSGETLWDIARKHKVTIAQLQRWNDLTDPSSVRAGTTLKVMKN